MSVDRIRRQNPYRSPLATAMREHMKPPGLVYEAGVENVTDANGFVRAGYDVATCNPHAINGSIQRGVTFVNFDSYGLTHDTHTAVISYGLLPVLSPRRAASFIDNASKAIEPDGLLGIEYPVLDVLDVSDTDSLWNHDPNTVERIGEANGLQRVIFREEETYARIIMRRI